VLGETKGEFLKRLQSKNPGLLIVNIETTGSLTDPRIVAKVRHNYLKNIRLKGEKS